MTKTSCRCLQQDSQTTLHWKCWSKKCFSKCKETLMHYEMKQNFIYAPFLSWFWNFITLVQTGYGKKGVEWANDWTSWDEYKAVQRGQSGRIMLIRSMSRCGIQFESVEMPSTYICKWCNHPHFTIMYLLVGLCAAFVAGYVICHCSPHYPCRMMVALTSCSFIVRAFRLDRISLCLYFR